MIPAVPPRRVFRNAFVFLGLLLITLAKLSAQGQGAPADGSMAWPTSSWQVLEGDPTLQKEDRFIRTKPGQEIGLRLNGLTEGRYFLRVEMESGGDNGEEELGRHEPILFVNGYPVQFYRGSPLHRVSGGIVTTVETADPIELHPTDQVRWNLNRPNVLVGAISTSRAQLALAPIDVSPFEKIQQSMDVIRVDGNFDFQNPSVPSPSGVTIQRKGNFTLNVLNLSGAKGEFQVSVEVRDYWQNVLASKEATISLNDRETNPFSLPVSVGNSDRCRAIVKITRAGGLVQNVEYEKLLENPNGGRPRLWLNDGWQQSALKDDGTLATRMIGDPATAAGLTNWQQVELPASWKDNGDLKDDHIGWYKKTFDAPTWQKDRRMLLHFSRVTNEARVFLNGTEIGSHLGPAPFDMEVTQALKPIGNELMLGVRDEIAALVPSELSAPTLHFDQTKSIRMPLPQTTGVGDIWLYGAGQKMISDVFVKPSFREKSLTLEITPPLLAPGESAKLENRVLYLGQEVLKFPDVSVTSSSPMPLQLTKGWAKPILWNRDDPKLLQLVTELKGADGKVLDAVDTRFGFREFWPQGRQLMWNGTPMKFAAAPMLSGWDFNISFRAHRPEMRRILLMMKAQSTVMERHVCDIETHDDLADEEGTIFALEVDGVVDPTVQKMTSDEHWQNADKFAQETIEMQRNHPSIVEWYLSNEFLATDEPANLARLITLGKAAREKDDTRILEFGCDLDLHGFTNIISTHYPVDIGAILDPTVYLPDGAYWRLLNETFSPGDHVPKGLFKGVANVKGPSPIVWGFKPIIINETNWDYNWNMPDGLSRLDGEAVYRARADVKRASFAATRWFVHGDRDAEASVIDCWHWPNDFPVDDSVPPVEINPVERYAQFYGGETVPFHVNINWDLFRNASTVFHWQLLDDQSHPLLSGHDAINFKCSDLRREQLALSLPEVTQKTACRLVMSLTEGGTTDQEFEMPVWLYPRQKPALPDTSTIAIYDPAGKTADALDAWAGTKFARLADLKSLVLETTPLLLLGENEADDTAAKEAFRNYITAGGRAVLFTQDKVPALLPFDLQLSKLVSSKLWSFRTNSPLIQGLDEKELGFWYPHHLVAKNLYIKPSTGGLQTLLDSGGPDGLVYSAIVQRDLGKGEILCSQIDFFSDLAHKPAASVLLSNLLRYASRPLAPKARIAFWGDSQGSVNLTLQSMRANVTILSDVADLKNYDGVLMEAGKALTPDQTTAFQSFLKSGGRLLIHGITPDNKQAVSQVVGQNIDLEKTDISAWQGRAIKVASNPVIDGLTNYDLFWKMRVVTESNSQVFYDPTSFQGAVGDWSVKPEHGDVPLYPGYLATAQVGKGAVCFDNLNWQTQSPDTVMNGRRIASVLLTNFGVPFTDTQRTLIPTDLSYQVVDLGSVMNRTLADDVAMDGKGGWTDQGPRADLRSFPTNAPTQTFKGLPFKINQPLGVLTMASEHNRPGLPASVTLPISGACDVLFFLQSSAWTGRDKLGTYTVNYSDGTQKEIVLSGMVNMRDWVDPNPDASFPYEGDTQTRVAWTGSSLDFPNADVYDMAWINPRPDVPIKDVTLTSEQHGIILLMAVTMGTRKAPAVASAPDTQSEKTDPDAAARLTDQGNQAAAQGKMDAAAGYYESAIKASPAAPEAYFAVAKIKETVSEYDAAIGLYNTYLQQVPDDVEALFRLGQDYEKEKQWSKAADAYRRSLAVNRNQPSTLNALQEVEKQTSGR